MSTTAPLVDATLLGAVESLLDHRGVTCGPLVETPPSLNAHLSDQAHVFVKVTRPGPSSPSVLEHDLCRAAAETTASAWAARHGVRVAEPLLPSPVVLRDGVGDPRVVTVLAWVQTCTPPSLVDRALDAVTAALDVSRLPVAPWLERFDVTSYARRSVERLSTVPRTALTDRLVEVLASGASKSQA